MSQSLKSNSLRIVRVEGEYSFRLFLSFGKFPTLRIRKNGQEALFAITESWKVEEWARVLASFPLSELATSTADQILAQKVFVSPAVRTANVAKQTSKTVHFHRQLKPGPLHDPLGYESLPETSPENPSNA